MHWYTRHAWISLKMNSTWHIHSLQANYHVPRVFFKFKPTMTHKARSTTHNQIRTHCCACAAAASHHISMRQSHQDNWFHSLPFQQFQALLTLFSKSFSFFPHGTCLLSVSNQYLALDEIYHTLDLFPVTLLDMFPVTVILSIRQKVAGWTYHCF